jgi:type II secretory pathway pseudopilin PulG
MNRKKCFTLLEVMVALALILTASGTVGLKMHQAVEKKRFQSDLQKLEARFGVCQRMAATMQSDWKGTLAKQGREWVFDAVCVDRPKAKPLRPLRLNSMDFFFEGKKSEGISIDFFSSGHVLPEGELLFKGGGQKKGLKIPQMFFSESKETAKNPAPVHPSSE